jgi:hypothetical protein
MNKLKFKAIISSLLLITFVVVAITGVGLWLVPKGPATNLADWKFLGIFGKHQLERLHTIGGFLMIVLIIVHLFSNWKIFMGELKVLFGIKKNK